MKLKRLEMFEHVELVKQSTKNLSFNFWDYSHFYFHQKQVDTYKKYQVTFKPFVILSPAHPVKQDFSTFPNPARQHLVLKIFKLFIQ